MEILITGGTGFIGAQLCSVLIDQDHDLHVLTRNVRKAQKSMDKRIKFVSSLQAIPASLNIDVVINLAGESIADKRWSTGRKKLLEQSRIDLTADLVAFMSQREKKPELLISGSAIGYYGDGGDNVLTEHSDANDEFSHRLCAAWEMQALRAKSTGVRVCILRTGLVVGKNGGFLKKMLPSFQFGMGARLADGKQWMSWIHLEDYINIILFLMEHKEISGIFNATAPNPVNNLTFTKTLASVLRRPSFLVLSASMLNKIFGEMSRLLATGQRVIPKKLLEANFEYKFPDLRPALADVCKK